MKWLAAAVLLACSAAEPEVQPRPPSSSLTTTCDSLHDAVGPACVPRFDSCADDALPKLGGGCEVVGNTTTILPNGSISVPSCAAPPGEAVFVDPKYLGSSDGTPARPYPTIAAALAVATTNVWLADGVYKEDVVIDKPITLEGACEARVTIAGLAAQSAIEVRAPATLRGLAVTGPRRGITFDGAKLATLERVHVHDTGDIGIGARNNSDITLRRVVVERAVEAGIASAGGSTAIEDALVADIKNGDGAFEGDGIYAGGDNTTKAAGKMTILRARIERVAGGGIAVQGSDVAIERTIVRRATFGIGHKAFVIGTPAKIKVTTTLIEDTLEHGIVASRTALEVDSVTIRRAFLGIAIFGPHVGFEPSVRNTTVEGARARGITVVDGSATVEAVVVRGTYLSKNEGCGLCASPSEMQLPTRLRANRVVLLDNARGGLMLLNTDAVVSRALIARNGTLGVSVANGTAKLSELVVRETRPAADGARGDGILAAYTAGLRVTLSLTDALIEKNRNIGVAVFGDAAISRTIVRDTTPRPGGLYGFGITCLPSQSNERSATLSLDNVLVERSVSAGVLVAQSTLELRSSTIRDTASDSEGAFGDGVTVLAGYRAGEAVAARATLTRVVSERNARAGISVMGSSLALTEARLRCNSVDLDVEEIFDTETRAKKPIDLLDGGGNDCSCDAAVARDCRAQTTGLLPVAIAE